MKTACFLHLNYCLQKMIVYFKKVKRNVTEYMSSSKFVRWSLMCKKFYNFVYVHMSP